MQSDLWAARRELSDLERNADLQRAEIAKIAKAIHTARSRGRKAPRGVGIGREMLQRELADQ